MHRRNRRGRRALRGDSELGIPAPAESRVRARRPGSVGLESKVRTMERHVRILQARRCRHGSKAGQGIQSALGQLKKRQSFRTELTERPRITVERVIKLSPRKTRKTRKLNG